MGWTSSCYGGSFWPGTRCTSTGWCCSAADGTPSRNRHSRNRTRNLTFFRIPFDLHVKVGVSSQCRKSVAGRLRAARPARRKETVMDFRLTPEEEAFREEVRDFIEKEYPAE